MPDSTVFNSLLSAVLAHGAGLGTHSCMLCLTSFLFTMLLAHVHERIPKLAGLMAKPVADGRAVSTVHALNLAILHILACVFLWTLMLLLQGWCSPDIMPNCHETTPNLFLPWLHLFFIHLLEPRPRASAHFLKQIDWRVKLCSVAKKVFTVLPDNPAWVNSCRLGFRGAGKAVRKNEFTGSIVKQLIGAVRPQPCIFSRYILDKGMTDLNKWWWCEGPVSKKKLN